ncbi:hypothetical protein Anas_06329 [Armadillidium nasatum]|uniref:Uncharacterized protein n=1 Tax=Armadillidium nasatum TaxID=96803 RepID=A0A5N5SV66_9CRUS|nr:hypothetical protein Anas_06329 [Armadillidium nasatum]
MIKASRLSLPLYNITSNTLKLIRNTSKKTIYNCSVTCSKNAAQLVEGVRRYETLKILGKLHFGRNPKIELFFISSLMNVVETCGLVHFKENEKLFKSLKALF